MPDFGDIADDAKKEAASHGQDVDKGITGAESQIDERTGNKGDDEVKKAGDEAETALGVDQSPAPS